jgi:molecular chaperone DnaK
VKDAEQHASEDMKRRAEVEARNKADSTVYSAEKFIHENGDKIPAANKAAIQSQIDETKAAIAGGDATGMESTADKLMAVMNEAGAAMYQQAGSTAGGSTDPNMDGAQGNGSDEDVIEGEFSDA